ncbi:unnamed protein product [Alopecurus aequalis]
MATDSSCRPPTCGHLPYSGTTSHSHLSESHSCCNNTYPPGYYSHRPPFPQELPPPHLYYHGLFPHHLNTYPSYFAPPPPYPAVDQIPYGYGYGKFKGHCCGCPNHICHGGERSKLKIEEEIPQVKPDSEQTGADNSRIIGRPSYQYPEMWLQSGNMKDDVKGRSFEMPPQLFSKWFPETGEWTGDGKQQSHDNHNARQFQWPLIWKPSHETKEFREIDQRPKVIDQSPKVTKEAPHSPEVKIIPLSWFENDNNDQKPVARDGSGEHNGRSSTKNQSAGAEHQHDTTVDRNCKTIPVMLGGVKNENKSGEENCKAISALPDKEGDEKKVRTCRTIPVMVQKNNDEKANNVEKEGENRKINNFETSKAKLSKLPPVCLRVDPLPRKKSANRSSGSLNPAIKKVREKENDTKDAQSKNQEKKLSGPNKDSQYKECNEPVKEKSFEMDKRIGSRNFKVQDSSVKPAPAEEVDEKVQHSSVKPIPVEEISTEVDEKVQPSISIAARQNESPGGLQECEKSTEEDEMKFQGESLKSVPEINLSEPDAAVCIQSAYRGYNVRRWQPLEKLRKVKKVHEQMQDLKKQLQGLEASSKQLTVKEQVAINETIMNLLLNLDSIQGLHPSVRETRKSVARELVCLQEKLDSLCKQLPSEPNQFRCEKEERERTDNAIQTTAHVSTAEASEEAKFAVVEEPGPRSVNSSKMMNDEASSGTPKALKQDAGSTEQKHEMEESSTTNDAGKAAPPGECQGTSSMDVLCDSALPGHSTGWKRHMEESIVMPREETSKTEKAAAKGEGHEVSSVDCVESLHDEQSSSEESCALEQCPASTEHNSCTEDLNTGVSSPGATEDGTTAVASLSMQNGEPIKDAAVEGEVWQSVALESSALKPDAAAATGDDQYKETSVQFAQPCVYLKDAELHEHDPHLDSIASNLGDEPGQARGADMQNHGADTMQDSSAREPDGTAEPTDGYTHSMHYVGSAIAEDSAQSPLLEEKPQSDSALLQESEAAKQCEVSCKDDPELVEQSKEDPIGGCSTGEKPEAVSLENEAKTMEGNLHVARVPNELCAEPGLPDGVSNESLGCQDGYMLHENPDSKMSLDNHSHSQDEYVSEDKTSEGTEASEAVECNEMLGKASACATEPRCAEVPADNPKADPGIQMASEEAATVPATHGAVKNEEKNLADENLKLKEMLQTLLSSGNDQMGIIAELSEKVKTLEGKLARKRRPKVRVYRPARNATANVH